MHGAVRNFSAQFFGAPRSGVKFSSVDVRRALSTAPRRAFSTGTMSTQEEPKKSGVTMSGSSPQSQVRSHQQSEYPQSQVPVDFVNFGIGQPSPRLMQLADLRAGFAVHFGSSTPVCSEEPLVCGVQSFFAENPHSVRGGETDTGSFSAKKNDDPQLGEMLQYGCASGHLSFRAALASFLSSPDHYGFLVRPEELLVTNGNSHAIQFCVRNLIEKTEEAIVMDSPTYFLVGDIMRRSGAQLELVRTCPRLGFDVDALEERLLLSGGSASSSSRKVRLVYISGPAHHNPTGASMKLSAARKLARLAREHDFWVLADEPYALLNFPPPRRTLAAEKNPEEEEEVRSILAAEVDAHDDASNSRLISLGTFSKIVAPGLRLGWVHTRNPALLQKLCQDPVVQSGGGFNPIVAGALHGCLATNRLAPYLALLNKVFAERRDALFAALHSEFGTRRSSSVHISSNSVGEEASPEEEASSAAVSPQDEELVACDKIPTGGYFAWLRFTRPGFNAAAFRDFLLSSSGKKYGVAFLHGARCTASSAGDVASAARDEEELRSRFRVCWAFYEAPELVEGVRRLRRAYDVFCSSDTLS